MQVRRKVALAVLTAVTALFATPATPAQAQYPPPQQGHWQITYHKEGQMTVNWTDTGGTPHSGAAPIGPSDSSTAPYAEWTQGCGTSGTMSFSVNVTIIVQWVDYMGNPTSVGAPNKVTVKVYSEAGRTAEGDDYAEGTGTGTANNGMGDPDVVIVSDAHGSTSESVGTHLIQRRGTSGHFEIPITLSALAQATGRYTCGVGCYYNVQAAIDTREVTVSSALDPTYHKGANGAPEVNELDANGTMFGDTVVPGLLGTNIAYKANPAGLWANGSEYHWYSSLTGYWDQGTFQPGAIPDLNPFYPGATAAGAQDHIFIHLIDSSDGADATANYYMRFHDAVENFITVTDNRVDGAWARVSGSYLAGQNGGSLSFQISASVSVSQSASGEAGLTVDMIAARLGFQLGVTYTSQINISVTYNLTPNMYCWVERRPFWRHRTGTADSYASNGYQGLLHWTADTAYHPQNPLIDFDERMVASPTPPGG